VGSVSFASNLALFYINCYLILGSGLPCCCSSAATVFATNSIVDLPGVQRHSRADLVDPVDLIDNQNPHINYHFPVIKKTTISLGGRGEPFIYSCTRGSRTGFSYRKPDRLQLHLFLIATITFRITQIKQPKWCNHWEIVEQKTGK